MATRRVTSKVLDYCFNPIHVVDDTKDIYVPCGKCDGCLLHKANDWSMRVGNEIDATPFSIFGTLTYSNEYIPKLKVVNEFLNDNFEVIQVLKVSTEFNNRWNGKDYVPRKEDFAKEVYYQHKDDFKPLINFPYDWYCSYVSKRDIILYLKLLRKDIIQFFNYDEQTTKNGLFRYFVISEYGSTTYRSHYHFLIFPKSEEIATYLTEYSLYQNWKMCDKDQFEPYIHYCDSGARNYVTQYLTRFNSLPDLYKFNKEIQPFRLASKNPAIGYVKQEDEEIRKNVTFGVTSYSRTIARLGESYIIQYPKDYLLRLFPKCKGFSRIGFSRMVSVYGCIYEEYRRSGRLDDNYLKRLRSSLSSLDYQAAKKCFEYCIEYGTTPSHYCYILDMYYYKRAMYALRLQYEYLDIKLSDATTDRYQLLYNFYVNSLSWLKSSRSQYGNDYVALEFLEGYGIYDLDDAIYKLSECTFKPDSYYKAEVYDIVQNMEKLPKFNYMIGNSPENV